MKLRNNLAGILIMILLCYLMTGCQKEVSESAQTGVVTENSDVTVNPTVTEACKPTSESSNVEADADGVISETGEEGINTETSWKQIKEIIPSEKKIQNRFAGFLNEDFGISTYQYGKLYYTIDGGETWTPGINQSACIAGLEIMDDKNAIITANYSEVRVSSDGGVNWNEVPKFGDMINEHCRYISFIDPNTGWIANRKEIGYTVDGGKTFESINVPQNLSDIGAIWLSSTTEGYILSTDDKLYGTTDAGKTWTEKELGLGGAWLLVCPAAALHVNDQKSFWIIAYHENDNEKGYFYYNTVDGGDTWEKELVVAGKPGFIYINREGTLLTISDDGGKTIRVFQYEQ
ncbi:MAG: hypothetical protein K0R34_1271 [Herbinix sp.]|jgi:photosystem II stability/assembly factor-like uncharacterized protein|nr:hypothetical protein [Herbinix sp.]